MVTTPHDLHDLIRVGVYAQVEGNLSIYHSNYDFSFYLNQISDMKPLLERITGRKFEDKLRIRFRSKGLYDRLSGYGFKQFHTDDWNIPNLNQFGELGKNEYFRALIDSLGNVDIDETVPYVRVSTINEKSLKSIANIFGGRLTGPYDDRLYLTWKGTDAIDTLNLLEWKFSNRRNSRGAQLIRSVRWEDYLI